MKFIYILIILALSTGVAKAEINTFICKGKNYFVSGENMYAPSNSSSETTFDLVVDSKKNDIYGYPNYVVLACFEATTYKCSMNAIALNCECQSNLGKASINLSRNSGKFSVIQTFLKTNSVQAGEYICTKVAKKLF